MVVDIVAAACSVFGFSHSEIYRKMRGETETIVAVVVIFCVNVCISHPFMMFRFVIIYVQSSVVIVVVVVGDVLFTFTLILNTGHI